MRQFAFINLFLSTLILGGCVTSSNIQVAEIKNLHIQVDESEEINHGSTFEIDVIAEMKNGSKKKITKHKDLKIESVSITKISGNNYQLAVRPFTFEDTDYKVSLFLQDETASILSHRDLSLNYMGRLNIDSESLDGSDGKTQRKSGVTLFSRDGVDGRDGNNGSNGENGGNYTAYIWKVGNEIRLRMENDSTGTVWKYKSRSCDSIIINISGGNGGYGSSGGEGGNGKDGKSSSRGNKAPGNGGDGGQGGDGGNGGNGGSILLFVHSSAKEIIPVINIIQNKGLKGTRGMAGIFGVSGKIVKGHPPGSSGKFGESGHDGIDGTDGPAPVISIINFDFVQLN